MVINYILALKKYILFSLTNIDYNLKDKYIYLSLHLLKNYNVFDFIIIWYSLVMKWDEISFSKLFKQLYLWKKLFISNFYQKQEWIYYINDR